MKEEHDAEGWERRKRRTRRQSKGGKNEDEDDDDHKAEEDEEDDQERQDNGDADEDDDESENAPDASKPCDAATETPRSTRPTKEGIRSARGAVASARGTANVRGLARVGPQAPRAWEKASGGQFHRICSMRLAGGSPSFGRFAANFGRDWSADLGSNLIMFGPISADVGAELGPNWARPEFDRPIVCRIRTA